MPWCRVLSFADPLPCQAAVQAGDVEILPTKRGRFHAEITQIGMNKLWMQRFKMSLPQLSNVAIRPGRKVVGFLIETSSSIVHHCGMEVTPNDILVAGFDLLHQRSDAGFHYGTMSLPIEEFSASCKAIVGREIRDEPQNRLARPGTVLMSRLMKLHNAIGRLAHDAPDIFDQPEVVRALEEKLIHVMIRCLAEGAGVETTTGGRRHDAIVSRFEQFLEANPDRPLYLTEICAAVGVAERTLRASCEEHLGMGPIRYLTLRRMHLVRRRLLQADASATTVTRVVTDHGFWELGRFSVAYRTLFGESPSETLRRPAQEAEIFFHLPSSRQAHRSEYSTA
jgi:AraC-like DNA-binding protein